MDTSPSSTNFLLALRELLVLQPESYHRIMTTFLAFALTDIPTGISELNGEEWRIVSFLKRTYDKNAAEINYKIVNE